LPSSHVPRICLTGPTAVGKTATIELLHQKQFPFEIVNADSFQIYRGLDIGTAKPSLQFRNELPHHGIDIRNPGETYSLGEFMEDAHSACLDIESRGMIPVLSGGTAFYIKHFFEGMPEAPPSDPTVRLQLEAELQQCGPQNLHERLAVIDPASAARIHVNDSYRVLRALEVWQVSNRPLSSFHRVSGNQSAGIILCMMRPRDILRSRIRERVSQMFRQGLSDEVQHLRSIGYTGTTPAMRAIGYREFFEHEDPVQIQESIVLHTCQYAKRQETFLRSLPGCIMFDVEQAGDRQKLVDMIMSYTLT